MRAKLERSKLGASTHTTAQDSSDEDNDTELDANAYARLLKDLKVAHVDRAPIGGPSRKRRKLNLGESQGVNHDEGISGANAMASPPIAEVIPPACLHGLSASFLVPLSALPCLYLRGRGYRSMRVSMVQDNFNREHVPKTLRQSFISPEQVHSNFPDWQSKFLDHACQDYRKPPAQPPYVKQENKGKEKGVTEHEDANDIAGTTRRHLEK